MSLPPVQTKAKLADLEKRLAELETRTDLKAQHYAEVRRSYESMRRQYQGEIKTVQSNLLQPGTGS